MTRPDLPAGERDSRAGFIVVAALWILAALATLAGIFAMFVSVSATSVRMHYDRVNNEAAVRAALEIVAHDVTGMDRQSRSMGSVGFRLDRTNVVAGFRSESARIDLNFAPKELLVGLFRSIGVSSFEAEDHAARIEAWRKRPAGGATNEDIALYRAAGLRYAPRQNAFPHVSELANVIGISDTLMARVAPLVTVYNGEPGIDIRIADLEVVAALPGLTRDRIDQILEARKSSANDQAISALLGSSSRYTGAGGQGALRVTVRAERENGKRLGADVVIMVISGDTEPYRILSWVDQFE